MGAGTGFDRVGGLLLFLVGAGAAWHGWSLQVAFAADPVGPKAFPILVGLVLAVCGASIALRPGETVWEVGDYWRIALVAVPALLYPFVLVPLGFVPATAILCFFGAKAFKARTVPAIVGAVSIAAVVFVLIDIGLGLGLPRGPLGV